MKFSVAHTFEPGLVPRLAAFPEVREVFGKMDRDIVGGGRSTYTLRRIGKSTIRAAVDESHRHGISFNYLINGATLGGIEQTRKGIRAIRRLLDFLSDSGVDAVTVASPFLARIVRRRYPHFKIRASAFAVVDSATKARVWEDLGADAICVSGIACNRNFPRLERIRRAVSCELQLIVNASCLPGCAYELTHMNLLTQSSRSGRGGDGFCLDYCFLHCSRERLRDPVNYIRSIWIRPEDLGIYEDLGYSYFKILERSCPADLLVKRVAAYAGGSFAGNLYELVAPVAAIKKELNATRFQRLRMVWSMFKPHKIKLRSLLAVHDYSRAAIPHDYSAETGPVYIDNAALDGFLDGLRTRNCPENDCESCDYCSAVAHKAVRIDTTYRTQTLAAAETLNEGAESGTLWE